MDTIVACASPWGQGGVAIIRMSGPDSIAIAKNLCQRKKFSPRYTHLCSITHNGILIDRGLVVAMPKPNSFTGENVVEISSHGNPLIVQRLIEACIDMGARLARAGEFSRRALENGKLSLLQAEALNSVVHARTLQGLDLAQKNLQGSLDEGMAQLEDTLLDIVAEIEARLDHPDDDLSFESDIQLCNRLKAIAQTMHSSAQNWRTHKIGIHGAKVALLGPVNAGKSSLFNHLIGMKRAIVSDIEGTTRDAVEKQVYIDGMEICFIDTAGARKQTHDPIEAQGIELGLALAKDVDLCLLLCPLPYWHQDTSYRELLEELAEKVSPVRILRVGSYLDCAKESTDLDVCISSKNGEGIALLKAMIVQHLRKIPSRGAAYTVISQRQYELFLALEQHCRMASQALTGFYGPAVAAEEVTAALTRLGELRGEEVRERVLDRLFSKFCIGK